ncbi:MAG: hypothetical protein M3R13_01960 [Armatimonadota bacterium]|nr:hypothetical protein [Armatimonadota bacterium]
MKAHNFFSLGIFIAGLIFAAGCGTASATSEAGTRVYAYDTSGSAKDAHEQFFNRGMQDMMSGDGRARFVVYRFDVRPQEAYQGTSFSNDEEAAMLLKSTFDRSAGAKGTNLLNLFQEIDSRLPDWSKPISIRIYTDCGTELMTSEEFKRMRALTERWKEQGTLPEISFVGVDTGHRETLRNHIAFPVEIN